MLKIAWWECQVGLLLCLLESETSKPREPTIEGIGRKHFEREPLGDIRRGITLASTPGSPDTIFQPAWTSGWRQNLLLLEGHLSLDGREPKV